jgi:hypothetical protein
MSKKSSPLAPAITSLVLVMILAATAYAFLRIAPIGSQADVVESTKTFNGPATYYTTQDFIHRSGADNPPTLIHRRAADGKTETIASIKDSVCGLTGLGISSEQRFTILSDCNELVTVRNADGKETVIKDVSEGTIAISPDGLRAFYFRQAGQNAPLEPKIYTIDTDSIKNLQAPANLKDISGAVTSATWFAPDKVYLGVYSSNSLDSPDSRWLYDLSAATLTKMPIDGGLVSPDGHRTAIGNADIHIKTQCNYGDLSSEYTTYKVSDGGKIGSFGVPGKMVTPVSFSPDGSQVLVKAQPIPTPPANASTKEECQLTDTSSTYYLMNIDGSDQKEVQDYAGVFKKWNVPVIANGYGPYPVNGETGIYQGNEKIISSSDIYIQLIGTTR